MTDLIQLVPIDELHESPTNPRTIFGDLSELAESIKKAGVLQPLMARRNAAGFEIVFGHRRFRAAALAGVEAVPVMVRELDDREVLEAQMVENVGRNDLHPLDEAKGFRRWHDEHSVSVDELAEKVGRSVAYVYARMKLCDASAKVLKALGEDQINASTALLLARIPVKKLQDEALRRVLDGGPWVGGEGTAMSYRQAKRLVADDYMLRLNDAPFDRGDASLTDAPACNDCADRTGNQPELFADVDSADVCTNPPCFAKKRAAHGDRLVALHKSKGGKVLSKKEGKELFPYSNALSYSAPFVDLDTQPSMGDLHHDANTRKKWRSLVGKAAGDEVVLARDPKGGVHELVPKKLAKKLLKELHPKLAPAPPAKKGSSGTPTRSAAQKKAEADRRVKEAARARAIGDIVATVEDEGTTIGADAFRLLAVAWLRDDMLDIAAQSTCDRREIDVGAEHPCAVLERELPRMTEPQVIALLLELAVAMDADIWRPKGDGASVLDMAAELFDVDLDAHKKAALATERKREADEKKAAAAKKKTKKRAAKKVAKKRVAKK